MSVIHDIYQWSLDRPLWQRDALRRLVLNDELSEDDLFELSEICKSAHGLAELKEIVPLAMQHIPSAVGSESVTLVSIFHHRGVNALAEGQTLNFAPNLTVVYGDNAAGKTGYIRILKSACRARGEEKILGNVVSVTAPLSPIVSIKYRVGIEPDHHEWAGGAKDEFISRVSVFDTQSAAVYLTEKTDVAFRPFGLDLFDKLVKACKAIRLTLENERLALASNALVTLQAQIPERTIVGKFLSNITSLTKSESLQTLACLSPEEETRISFLEKSILDLQANDPETLIKHLTLRVGRVRALARHLKEVESVLSTQSLDAVFEARNKVRRKNEEARRLRDTTFSTEMLVGTGSTPWTALWEAARRFSQEQAYPGQAFPVVANDAVCVLCQQNLHDHAVTHRLQQLEAFVASTTERELRQLKETYTRLQKSVVDLQVTTEASSETLLEIYIDNKMGADAINAALATNTSRHNTVLSALAEDKELDADCLALVCASGEADALLEQIEGRIVILRTSKTDEARHNMAVELEELRARRLLGQHTSLVLDEIDRKKKIAAYGLCINDTATSTITQKNTSVTKVVVSKKLKQSFKDELENVGFRHVGVELKEAGGSEGVLYHKVILTSAPGVELPKVVSEGEQRCLSIAAFFAELSTADDPSGIVFDDPVSSLDYKWREGVARRLVQEAKTRQVIIFTHDVVFLLLLKQFAEEERVAQLDQYVHHLSKGAGVCVEELPWVAMPVKKKIAYMNKEWQAVAKLFREGQQAIYEKEATYLYGLLREAWERAVEEVLLGGIVERYRPSVQTKHIDTISDITLDNCRAVNVAMTKCSKWLPGHDLAAAARAPVPEPEELKRDIDALEQWVNTIRKRRG